MPILSKSEHESKSFILKPEGGNGYLQNIGKSMTQK